MIDAHLHLTHSTRSVADTIAHIETIGAEKAVILPIEDGDGEFEWMTEDVVAAYAQYPHRIIPFCHVDVTREDAVAELEKRAASGVFKGYGEQKQHVRLDDPRLARVLAVCDELHWPVTWHFQEGENGYNQRDRTPRSVAEKISQYPIYRPCPIVVGEYQRGCARTRRNPVPNWPGQTRRLN